MSAHAAHVVVIVSSVCFRVRPSSCNCVLQKVPTRPRTNSSGVPLDRY